MIFSDQSYDSQAENVSSCSLKSAKDKKKRPVWKIIKLIRV